MWKLDQKEEKICETVLAKLWLEDEYNYKILFTKVFWKLWRNISADKRQHNLEVHQNGRINPPQTVTFSRNWLSINRVIIPELCLWVLFSSSTMNSSTFTSFCAFLFCIFSSLITSDYFYFLQKLILKITDHLI